MEGFLGGGGGSLNSDCKDSGGGGLDSDCKDSGGGDEVDDFLHDDDTSDQIIPVV